MIEWHCVPNMPNIIRKSFSNEIHVNGNAVLTAHTSCSYTMHTCPKAQLIFNSNQLGKKILRKRKKNRKYLRREKNQLINKSWNKFNCSMEFKSFRSNNSNDIEKCGFPAHQRRCKKKEKTRKRSKLKIHDGLNQGFK